MQYSLYVMLSHEYSHMKCLMQRIAQNAVFDRGSHAQVRVAGPVTKEDGQSVIQVE